MRISVTRLSRSSVRPSQPTPFESLGLSAIDLFPGSRDELIESLHVFKHGQQPATVIKEALSEALVWYHPLAGRFVDGGQAEAVVVECNEAGVWFTEAAADCTLEDVEYLDRAPLMISKDDLLPDLPSKVEPRDVPIRMQVTEFRCGGFVVGLIFHHAIVDGIGAAQFMKAIGDFARGGTLPAVNPIWSRHLIPNPPKLPLGPPPEHFPTYKLQSFCFDLPVHYVNEVKSAYIKKFGRYCTTFEISTATLWQARTRAIYADNPKTPVHLIFGANVRRLLTPNILPQEGGYYGNCLHLVTITAAGGSIVGAELVDIVTLIQEGKERLSNEFEKWTKGELREDSLNQSTCYNTLYVTDWSNLEFSEVDFGWGKSVHVIPFIDKDCPMAFAMLGKPLPPKRGSKLTTQCVTEEHMPALQELINRLL